MSNEPAVVDGVMAEESSKAQSSKAANEEVLGGVLSDLEDDVAPPPIQAVKQAAAAIDPAGREGVLGTTPPKDMRTDEIERELEAAELPREHLNRAREKYAAAVADVKATRDELDLVVKTAEGEFHAASNFAHQLAKRRGALTREFERRNRKT